MDNTPLIADSLKELFHEMKTPMTLLRERIERQVRNELLPLSFRSELTESLEDISHLVSLIDTTVYLIKTPQSFSQVGEECSLVEIILRAIETLEPLWQGKNQKVTFRSHADRIVRGDKSALFRLFFNLLENSVLYAPELSLIQLTLEIHEEKIIFTLSDNGTGIAPEREVLLFIPFACKTKGGRSMGLGLSLCKTIVEAHNGTLILNNHYPHGLSFVITFPWGKIS